ncbi:MAG TPA: hypothetical protein VK588_05650, partial [Chitinophagaceae bacterium]|nr:hypothetical protein [Chitinophagaceae bacterium]
GRGFWILDDITPLRQLSLLIDGLDNRSLNTLTVLFKPQTATRVRWNMNTDTPLPQEEPAGQNPPEGAIVDYDLPENSKEVSLEILDSKEKLVRRYSSTDSFYKIPPVDIPLYWIRPQQILSVEKGSHRFFWDMHYTPFNEPPGYPIAAIYKNTAPAQSAPWVMPGTYTIKLSVDGKNYFQKLTIRMDPRVKTSMTELQNQHDLSMICDDGRKKCIEMLNEIGSYRVNIKNQAIDSLSLSIVGLNGTLASLQGTLQNADVAPTSQLLQAVHEAQKNLEGLVKKWNVLKSAK